MDIHYFCSSEGHFRQHKKHYTRSLGVGGSTTLKSLTLQSIFNPCLAIA